MLAGAYGFLFGSISRAEKEIQEQDAINYNYTDFVVSKKA